MKKSGLGMFSFGAFIAFFGSLFFVTTKNQPENPIYLPMAILMLILTIIGITMIVLSVWNKNK